MKDSSLRVGVGLRHAHFPTILESLEKGESLPIDWFEGISENFIHTRGRPFDILQKVREQYPISLHGVSLSIASHEELDFDYLKKLKDLYQIVKPVITSDHLCWTGLSHNNVHNLLPFSYDERSLKHIVDKINAVQDYLERPMAFENLSAYMTVETSEMTEAEFLKEICALTQCRLLLDVNNVYVNSYNQGFDAQNFFETIPYDHVDEIHLAGFTDMGDFLFDTHGEPVHDEVWDLYKSVCHNHTIPTLIEWDENIPSFERVLEEADKARSIQGEGV